MDKWEGLVAVVAGASAGIGRAMAIALAEHGMIVVAIARRQQRLEEMASSFKGKGKIVPMAADVSDESAVENAFQRIENEVGQVRVLVNNAGIGYNKDFMDFDMNIWRTTFNVNLFGLAYCTKQVVLSARKHKPGLVHIVNINSVFGHVVTDSPKNIIYCMTKHCMTMLTRQFMRSTSKDDIKFTSLSPGSVDTEMFEAGGWDRSEFSSEPMLTSEECADALIDVLSAPPNVVYSELIIQPKGEIL